MSVEKNAEHFQPGDYVFTGEYYGYVDKIDTVMNEVCVTLGFEDKLWYPASGLSIVSDVEFYGR